VGNGLVNGHPMAHHRWLPSIEKGNGVALDELIETSAASFEAGQAWAADADLTLFEAPTEELARLEVRELIDAYHREVGVCWDGGTGGCSHG
jgi:acetoacetate decarboxylase